MRRSIIGATICLSLALGMPAVGQAGVAPRPAPCASAPYHQFDFWAGSWVVRDPQGHLQGTNQVGWIQNGCVLQEHWKGTDGSGGTSFNIYYAGDRQWHQTWVDNAGGLLVLAGGVRDGAMVLSGPRRTRAGTAVLERITWTKLAGGDVHQVWDRSSDGGKTWSLVFDGIYSPR